MMAGSLAKVISYPPPPSHMHTHTHTHARTHALTPTHTHAHAHTHARTHARTDAHTHTHTDQTNLERRKHENNIEATRKSRDKKITLL